MSTEVGVMAAAKFDSRQSRALREAKIALEAGDSRHSAALYQQFLTANPDNPEIQVRFARALLIGNRPEDALEQIDAAIAMAHEVKPRWLVLRSRVLAQLFHYVDAEAQLRDLIAKHPDFGLGRITLIQILREQGKPAEALEVLDGARLEVYPCLSQALNARSGLLFKTGQRPEAKEVLRTAIETATSAAELSLLFRTGTDILGGGDALRSALSHIRDRLQIIDPIHERTEKGELLLVRLSFALAEYREFRRLSSDLLDRNRGAEYTEPLKSTLRAFATPIKIRQRQAKVFGIGLSRTGTSSLNAALTRIGYNSYHWAHPISHQLLRSKDADFCDGLTDIPAVACYRKLAGRFPNARFILTERPIQDWVISMQKHRKRWFGVDDLDGYRDWLNDLGTDSGHKRLIRQERRVYAQYGSYPEAYQAHIDGVRQFFEDQPNRLLRINIFEGDGWKKLCAFLNVPVPNRRFPAENQAIS